MPAFLLYCKPTTAMSQTHQVQRGSPFSSKAWPSSRAYLPFLRCSTRNLLTSQFSPSHLGNFISDINTSKLICFSSPPNQQIPLLQHYLNLIFSSSTPTNWVSWGFFSCGIWKYFLYLECFSIFVNIWSLQVELNASSSLSVCRSLSAVIIFLSH